MSKNITKEEFLKMFGSTGYRSTGNSSTGDYSTGNRSTGYRSTGYWSTGDYSTGSYSTGDESTGSYSTGFRSTGHWSTGDWSTGNRSTGSYSTGHWSISNYSTGHFSTEDYTGFGCFDKPCTPGEWNDWEIPNWLYFQFTEWISEDDMTEKEKKDNPTYRTTGGYLKVYDYKEVFQASYNKATREEQLMIKKAPNFNADKFYQISGIKVDEEPEVKIEIEGKFYPISQIKKALSKLN